MRKNKIIGLLAFLCFGFNSQAQVMSLDSVFNTIKASNPGLKMYDADIRSMDEAAKGARSWMPPEAGAGFYMTPYNPKKWSSTEMGQSGQFMITAQQMFPNKSKLNAESKYIEAMSSVEKERKNVTLNELY